MILCLDVGNSQLYGGVFTGDELAIQFRRNTASRGSSDELGLFLRSVLRENDVDPAAIDQIAICSVVPDYVYSLRACCEKYRARTTRRRTATSRPAGACARSTV